MLQQGEINRAGDSGFDGREEDVPRFSWVHSAGLAATLGLGATVAEAAAVAEGDMPAHCRSEVSVMYGTAPAFVTLDGLVRAEDGGGSIRGTVDKGDEGIKEFLCRFAPGGDFIDVMALTSDGE